MGPFIVRAPIPHPEGVIDMGNGITVTLPPFVNGPHRWQYLTAPNGIHNGLVCDCGWRLHWEGTINRAVDSVWRAHSRGEDDT